MKAVTSIGVVCALMLVAQAETGTDCSTDSTVCDRNSECCGTGKKMLNTDGSAITGNTATTDVKVCY